MAAKLWCLTKATGVVHQVTTSKAVADLAQLLPAEQYPTRIRIVMALCDEGMIETAEHAYSTVTAAFHPLLEKAA